MNTAKEGNWKCWYCGNYHTFSTEYCRDMITAGKRNLHLATGEDMVILTKEEYDKLTIENSTLKDVEDADDRLIEKVINERDRIRAAAQKVVDLLSDGLMYHAPYCNFTHPSCKHCNCGLADLREALKRGNKQGRVETAKTE